MIIECRRYEKPLKSGLYHARTVFRVTGDEVLYKFETESDGYQVGASTPKQFRQWMKGTLPRATEDDRQKVLANREAVLGALALRYMRQHHQYIVNEWESGL